MPIYEYKCLKCNTITEDLVKLNEVKVLCNTCNTVSLVKIMSSSNFHLKGDGWYKTDYNRIDRAIKS